MLPRLSKHSLMMNANRHSSNLLGRNQDCAGFDACRGQYEARMNADQLNACCSCNTHRLEDDLRLGDKDKDSK